MAQSTHGGRGDARTAGKAVKERLPDGTAPRKGRPPNPGEDGESARPVDEKVKEARREVEREGANTPRE